MMTHDDLNQAATASLEDRVRDAIKGVLEQVMEEEIGVNPVRWTIFQLSPDPRSHAQTSPGLPA